MKRVISALLAAAVLVSALMCYGCGKEGQSGAVESSETDREQGFVELDSSVFDDIVIEEDVAAVGVNVINDSDFSGDQFLWTLYTESGGSAKLSKQNEQCVVEIQNGGTVSHAVQIFYDGFKMNQFAKYEFSFTASSSINKILEARIQLNGGDYHAYAIKFVELTAEPQRFVIPFTMNYETDKSPRLAFNMGRALDGSEDDAELTDYTIIFDDISIVCTDDSQVEDYEEAETIDIITNQVGYEPDAEKKVTFRGFRYVDTFSVNDSEGNVVYTGTVTEPTVDFNTWEYVWYGDFSEITEPGVYTVNAGVLGESFPFTIGEGIYDDAFADVVHMFYLQRCGMELTKEYADSWAHDACHSGMARVYGTDTFIDVSGGWHDAGDYGRYVSPGAKAAADLMLAYEAVPGAFGDDTNIPESGNGVPDVLDEVRYELEWMLKMQDEESGGVYHKVTCADFPDNVMPEFETEELILCPPSVTASGDFAAVMAMAYRIYGDIDPDFAARCLSASKAAWEYTMSSEAVSMTGNPEGITTGEYSDRRSAEEKCWSSAELFRITGEAKYEEAAAKSFSTVVYTGFGWANVGGYAINTYLAIDESLCDPELREKFYDEFIAAADACVEASKADAYSISLNGVYPWGSNMSVANNAMLMLLAYDLTGNDEYVYYAQKHIDYLFGMNPVSTCFVTGQGTVSPVSTHHRPSLAVDSAMPGMLVGGPDSALEDPFAKSILATTAPAKCYVDNFNSYSCNEITIYWNSPLVYIMARLCK